RRAPRHCRGHRVQAPQRPHRHDRAQVPPRPHPFLQPGDEAARARPRVSVVIILVGGQGGPEGNGTVLDYLASHADMVIRTQRGGTTVRGIGPAYSDKVRRIGFRIGDVQKEAFMRKKLAFVVGQVKNPILTKLYEKEPYDLENMLAEYMGYARELDPFIKDTFPTIHDALDSGANILLEGAQATMLDLDFGTYPYVTSSNPTAGGALTGSGIPPTKVDLTIG